MAHQQFDEAPLGDEKVLDGHDGVKDIEGQDPTSPEQDYDVERVEKVYR